MICGSSGIFSLPFSFIFSFITSTDIFFSITFFLNCTMDENDDSDDEAVGDILFGHVNEHSLRIVSETLDDLFTGVSSKKRFSRAPNQDHMTFIPQTEFMIYSNFHVIPHLRHLFASGANLFIWLAVLMEFRQVIIYQCIGSIFFQRILV